MASLPGLFNLQEFTSAGDLAALYRLYTYAPGTTTHKAIYTDQAGTIPHTYVSDGIGGLYIALNARGELPAPPFCATGGYDFVLREASGLSIVRPARRVIGSDDLSASAVVDLENRMADTTDVANGAGKIGFVPSLSYLVDTAGYWLRDVAAWLPAWAGAVARTIKNKLTDQVSVMDFMTDAQRADAITGVAPVIDSSPAFNACWDFVKTRGGKLFVPPGNYLWNSQILADVTSPVNLCVEGFGATIYCGASVTGAAFQVTGAYNQFSLDIIGMSFNMRGNTTAQGCFEVLGGHNVKIRRCTSEQHGTRPGWYFAKFGTRTPGGTEDDWNSFWCGVYECNTRMRSGGDGAPADYGIVLEGATNSFEAIGNIFSDVNEGIRVTAAATTKTLPNSIVLERNAFESITTAGIVCVGTPAQLGPTGWRIIFNRVETCPIFVSFTTGGAAMTQHSQPPFLIGNYCTAGSVATWINNPTGYQVSVFETRSPGFGPLFDNQMWQAGSMKFNFADGSGLALANGSGGTDYTTGWMSQGGYRYWTNTGVGKFYVKAGTPSTNTDGAVVGTQA